MPDGQAGARWAGWYPPNRLVPVVEAGPDHQRLDLVQPMPADQAGDRGRGQCRSPASRPGAAGARWSRPVQIISASTGCSWCPMVRLVPVVEAGADPNVWTGCIPCPMVEAGDCRSGRCPMVEAAKSPASRPGASRARWSGRCPMVEAGADPQRLDLVQTVTDGQAGARGQGCPMVRLVPAEQAGARGRGRARSPASRPGASRARRSGW
jgi:hypothetical protein